MAQVGADAEVARIAVEDDAVRACVAFDSVLHHGEAVVGRRIVRHDDRQRRIVLRQRAFDRGGDRLALVVGDHQHRDRRVHGGGER